MFVHTEEVTYNNCMYITPEIIDEVAGCCHCAIIYDSDTDFGTVSLIEPEIFAQPVVLPSAKIDPEKLAHLSSQQRVDLLRVLDKFPDVFSDTGVVYRSRA